MSKSTSTSIGVNGNFFGSLYRDRKQREEEKKERPSSIKVIADQSLLMILEEDRKKRERWERWDKEENKEKKDKEKKKRKTIIKKIRDEKIDQLEQKINQLEDQIDDLKFENEQLKLENMMNYLVLEGNKDNIDENKTVDYIRENLK